MRGLLEACAIALCVSIGGSIGLALTMPMSLKILEALP